MRAKHWEKAETTINVMEDICRVLASVVQKAFIDTTEVRKAELVSIAHATEASSKFLKKLNLFEPINNIELLISNLGRYDLTWPLSILTATSMKDIASVAQQDYTEVERYFTIYHLH